MNYFNISKVEANLELKLVESKIKELEARKQFLKQVLSDSYIPGNKRCVPVINDAPFQTFDEKILNSKPVTKCSYHTRFGN